MAPSDPYRYRDVGYDPGRVRPGHERHERSADRDVARDPYADSYYGARRPAGGEDRERDAGRSHGAEQARREPSRGGYAPSRDERPSAERHRADPRSDDRHRDDDRGFANRAGDEVRSWFGDDDAERRRRRDGARDEEYDAGGRYIGARYASGRDPTYNERGPEPRAERGRDDERYRSWGGDTWRASGRDEGRNPGPRGPESGDRGRGRYDTPTPARHDERGGQNEEERYRLQGYGYRMDRHRDD